MFIRWSLLKCDIKKLMDHCCQTQIGSIAKHLKVILEKKQRFVELDSFEIPRDTRVSDVVVSDLHWKPKVPGVRSFAKCRGELSVSMT